MTTQGSIERSAPVLFHVKTAEMRGRGERIRTSGPCLPKALPLASRADLSRLSLRWRYAPIAHVPASLPVRGSKRASNPCPRASDTHPKGRDGTARFMGSAVATAMRPYLVCAGEMV
jgi:hypothetical protein